MEILKSNKNKNMIVFNGYIYVVDKCKNEKIYWRCNIRDCPGRCITRVNYEQEESPNNIKLHNHLELIDKIEAL